MQQSEAPNEATLTTDQEDYPPYSYVYFTGTGFQPGETVNMIVVELDPDPAVVRTVGRGGRRERQIQTSWYIFSEEFHWRHVAGDRHRRNLRPHRVGHIHGRCFQLLPDDDQSLTATAAGQPSSFRRTSLSVAKAPAYSNVTSGRHGPHPIPSGWVTTLPSPLTFTGATNPETKTWTVFFTVPSGAAAGTYTASNQG